MGALLDAAEPFAKSRLRAIHNLVKSIGKIKSGLSLQSQFLRGRDWRACEIQGFIPHREVSEPPGRNAHFSPIRGVEQAGKLQPRPETP